MKNLNERSNTGVSMCSLFVESDFAHTIAEREGMCDFEKAVENYFIAAYKSSEPQSGKENLKMAPAGTILGNWLYAISHKNNNLTDFGASVMRLEFVSYTDAEFSGNEHVTDIIVKKRDSEDEELERVPCVYVF